MNVITHADLYDYHTYRKNCYIAFDGLIREVGPMAQFDRSRYANEPAIDLHGQLMLPGMVSCHSHLYGAFLRGMPVNPYHPITFLEKLQQLFWKLDSKLDLEAIYQSAMALAPEHVKCGVTTIIDHHASGTVTGSLNQLKKAWVQDAGLRGVFAFETSDRFPVDECIAENISFYKENAYQGNCGAMFGMHASMSLSDATLRKAADAIGHMPLHVHIGESAEDEADCVAHYGKRIVERFIGAGLVNERSLFAHCCNINDREAALMGDRHVTVVTNVLSNANGGVGLPDDQLLERYGVPMTIGNDTLGTNIAADIRATLYLEHLKMQNTWWFGTEKLKQMVIQNYRYASMLLGTRLGRFETGYCADFLSLHYDPITPMDDVNIFDHLVDGVFSAFRPRNVWCAGAEKLIDYETVFDETAIAASAQETAARIYCLLE